MSFSANGYSDIVDGFTVAVVEDFEGFDVGNIEDDSMLSIGKFSSVGGVGTGGTVNSKSFPGVNDGSKLAIRKGNVFGRSSTTRLLSGAASDDKFLDSNDTYGIAWEASLGGNMFDKIVLTLSDAADTGAIMKISVNGAVKQTLSKLGNGNKKTVVFSFDEAVSSAQILFENVNSKGQYRKNDGFSLDDIAFNDVTAVPLPASALMLLAGLGGLGAMRRFRKA